MTEPIPPASRTGDWRLWVGAVLVLLLILGVVVWQRSSSLPEAPHAEERASEASAPPLDDLPARRESLARPRLAELPEFEARARNAAVPFADARPAAARPFIFEGSSSDRARAVDCLAIAALAEAGGSDEGQRAVMQVVLNRVRHPAFPRTVCGTVFQGSERATGCQFTFTCDGALSRRYSDAAWSAARQRAQEALGGRVFAQVGTATHYHTDWVYPYWSAELDKIGQVDTHLFFRWRGYWGTRQAARMAYRGGEPAIGPLGTLPAHAAAVAEATDAQLEEAAAEDRLGGGSEVVLRHPNGGAFLIHLSSGANADAALALGRQLCAGDGYCQVMGWLDRAVMPAAYPVSADARRQLTFSYVLDAAGKEIVLYDCRHFAGVARDNCIPPARR